MKIYLTKTFPRVLNCQTVFFPRSSVLRSRDHWQRFELKQRKRASGKRVQILEDCKLSYVWKKPTLPQRLTKQGIGVHLLWEIIWNDTFSTTAESLQRVFKNFTKNNILLLRFFVTAFFNLNSELLELFLCFLYRFLLLRNLEQTTKALEID